MLLAAFALLLPSLLLCARDGPEFTDEELLEAVLVEIYGVAWARRKQEEGGKSLCDWEGIECQKIQEAWRVSRIMLKDKQIEGRLPDSLGELTWLQHLQIQGSLCGKLPKSLSRLGRLETLDLSQNGRLEGPLPASLGSLKRLQTLRLSHTGLSGELPPELGSLHNLAVLEAPGCAFSGQLPEAIGQLTKLKVLIMDDNKLQGPLPRSIGFLSQLSILRLSNNELSGSLPDSFGELGMLSFVDFDHNRLEGDLPASLGRLKQINYFHASGNKFSQEVPFTMAALPKLVKFVIDPGKNCAPLSRDPCGFFHLEKDACLLPTDMSQAVQTALSDVWGANYEQYKKNLGPCPCRWPGVLCQNMTGAWAVWGLHLEDDKLAGKISEALGGLKELRSLRLQGRLAGQLPAALLELSQLAYLDLSGNLLQGEVPSLAALSQLAMLSLSGNQFSGKLPVLPSKLQVVDLSQNKFTGELPAQLLQIESLRTLDVGRNSLAGALPNFLPPPTTQLAELRLGANRFERAIPDSFQKLVKLQELDLSETSITGPVRSTLEQLPMLWSLKLGSTKVAAPEQILDNCAPLLEDPCDLLSRSDRPPLLRVLENLRPPGYWRRHAEEQYDASMPFCSFTGVRCEEAEGRSRVVELQALGETTALHPDIQQLKHLRRLHVTSFQGALPETLANLPRLVDLHVQGTYTGPMPSWLGKLTSLQKLSLQGSLSGSVPASLSNLKELTELNLNGNMLRDFFPRVVSATLANLGKLTVLDMSRLASLHGHIPAELATHLPLLRALYLSENSLSGTLPEEVSQLSHLEDLDLSSNKLTGQVPASWKTLTKLHRLDLEDNTLLMGGMPARITVSNCAPLSRDPCSLFDRKVDPRTGLGIFETSLMLSLLLMLDRFEQRLRLPSRVPRGALELVARHNSETSHFGYAFSMAVAVAHVGAPAAFWWYSSLYGYFLLVWLMCRQLISFVFTGSLELHPLRWCFPQGLALSRVRQSHVVVASSLTVVLSGFNILFASMGLGIKEDRGHMIPVMVVYHSMLLIIACVSIYRGSSGLPVHESDVQQARESLQRAALLVEFVTSSASWADDKDRTLYVDLALLDSGALRPAGAMQVEMQATSTIPSQASQASGARPLQAEATEAVFEKLPVRITVANRFAHGGPLSLTLRWSDPDTGRIEEHQVWMLEPGPFVIGRPGGLVFDLILVLLIIILCLNLARILIYQEFYWFPSLLLAAVWRITIWNLRSWFRLYQDIPESLSRGFYTDSMVQIRHDAFGAAGTVLMAATFCQLKIFPTMLLENELDAVIFEATVAASVAIVGAQLRLRDKMAGLA